MGSNTDPSIRALMAHSDSAIGVGKTQIWQQHQRYHEILHNQLMERVETTMRQSDEFDAAAAIGSMTICSQDEGDWCNPHDDEQIICYDEGIQFLPEEWADGRDVDMYIFPGAHVRVSSIKPTTSVQFYFILLDGERIMIKAPDAREWKLECIYDQLTQFLSNEDGCGVKPGTTYSVVFALADPEPVTVTKRRRLVIDVMVDVELADPKTPVISPGRMLYDAGDAILSRLRECPHTSNIQVMHWNVDHADIEGGEILDDKDAGVDYLKFNDRPGIWDCDRVNSIGDKR